MSEPSSKEQEPGKLIRHTHYHGHDAGWRGKPPSIAHEHEHDHPDGIDDHQVSDHDRQIGSS